MGGGFGFGMLADVQMLGFYQAQHPRTHKPFLAYVLQVATTASTHFLIYRYVQHNRIQQPKKDRDPQ